MKALRASFTRLLRRPSADDSVSPLPNGPDAAPELPDESKKRMRTIRNTPVLALLLCSFHHSKGPVIEYVQPTFLDLLAHSAGVPLTERSPSDEGSPSRSSTHPKSPFKSVDSSPSESSMRNTYTTDFAVKLAPEDAIDFENFELALHDPPASDLQPDGVSFIQSDNGLIEIEAASLNAYNLACRYSDLLASAHIIPFLALPDGSHKFHTDYVYFLIPGACGRPLFCVSCSRRIAADRLHHVDDDVTRNQVQKSVCVVSQIPAFGYIRSLLAPVTASYFQQRDFRDTAVLDRFFAHLSGYPSIWKVPCPSNIFNNVPQTCWEALCEMAHCTNDQLINLTPSELNENYSPLRCVLSLVKPKQLFTILKCVLLEKRIIIYGDDAARVSAFILGLTSLLPGLQTHGVILKNYSEDSLSRLHRFGFPLTTFYGSCPLLPITSLQMLNSLNKCKGFLAGATNGLWLTQSVLTSDLVVTLRVGHKTLLDIRNRSLQTALHLSDYEMKLVKRNLTPLIQTEVENSLGDESHFDLDELNKDDDGGDEAGSSVPSESETDAVAEPSPLLKSWQTSSAVSESDGSSMFRLLLRSGGPSARGDKRAFDGIVSRITKATPLGTRTRRRSSVQPNLPRHLCTVNDQDVTSILESNGGAMDLLYLEVRKYFENLLRLCAKAAGPERSANALKRAAESRSLGLSNFNASFIKLWTETHNCVRWVAEHQLPMMPTLLEPPKHGWARYIYGNGDMYSGQFKHALRHGQGVYMTASGVSYDGTWINDKRHGFGIFKHPAVGYSYTGEWREDMKWGEGVLISTKEQYWGSFQENRFHGHGVHIDIFQNHYEGDFVDGLFHGKGKIKRGQNETYTGDWRFGKEHGRGCLIWKNGRCYEGSFVNGTVRGHGKMTYEDGGVFDGCWDDGRKNGAGIYTFVTKSRADLPSSNAPLSTPITLTLEGVWHDNAPLTNVEWRLHSSEGEAYRGYLQITAAPESRDIWGRYCSLAGIRNLPPEHRVRDRLRFSEPSITALCYVLVLPDTEGVAITASGDRYTGRWHEGVPHGEGSLFTSRKGEFSGKWLHGKFVDKPDVPFECLNMWIHLQNLPLSFLSSPELPPYELPATPHSVTLPPNLALGGDVPPSSVEDTYSDLAPERPHTTHASSQDSSPARVQTTRRPVSHPLQLNQAVSGL